MKSKLLRLFILFLLSLFLSSCLSLTSGLSHQNSGAGSLSLEYRLNKKAIGIQKDSINSSNLIPLPLSRNDFDEMTAQAPGITLRSFSETEDSDYVYIETEVNYESLNDLSSFLGFPIEFSSSGNLDTLVLKIYEAEAAVSSDTQSILDSVFVDDTLSFEFSFPRNVINSSYGAVNGRTVTYEISLPDVYRQSGFIWTLEW
ncbi:MULTISPECIES: hypothetical protein [unclassified Oceanispirochaeta]|uniref:hypothetical protein n=1 Tax=unclassified Oceanispirochaeta TaxID=2635722 RepID=UPI000E09A85D|nr:MULTISPECIES: hypothetical protein [unclassified Oceanispirochaeta]MBF9015040.1 hypothetical protein [Oceanispirochaeta sp. M2]NPD71498.1 hypothetical protein [Oceanispirochaeta sp. M1]RDG33073.1 hypothetical protein DV872_05235 [Oceanispirochaeta sp. M1]